MGASQRTKGAAAEREVAKLLHDELGVTVRRRLEQTQSGGHDLSLGRIAIEVKRQERASLATWMAQAVSSALDWAKVVGNGFRPLTAVWWRPSRQEWLVVMHYRDWCELVREAGAFEDEHFPVPQRWPNGDDASRPDGLPGDGSALRRIP